MMFITIIAYRYGGAEGRLAHGRCREMVVGPSSGSPLAREDAGHVAPTLGVPPSGGAGATEGGD